MADPTKNIRKFAGYGIIVGIVLSALANGAIIIRDNPEAGQKISGVYVWLLPIVGAILGGLHLFRVKKIPTKMNGFFIGFSISTAIINFIIIGMIEPVTAFLQSSTLK